jgi:hypothetical protein
VKLGSVSDSTGVPGGTGSPSFTNTCPTRIGHVPTIMSVGTNTTSFWIERRVTVTEVWPARRSAVPSNGSKSWPGCAVPTA